MSGEFTLMGLVEYDPKRVLIARGDRYFRVSHALWHTIDAIQGGTCKDQITQQLVKLHPYENSSGVEHPILSAARNLMNHAPDSHRKRATPYAGIEMDATHLVSWIAARVGPHFFNYRWLLCLSILSVWGLTLYPMRFMPPLSLMEAGVSIAAMLIVMACHELGHSVAAARYGCRHHRIGLGVFFILPVFYADVSEIWRLPVPKRIVVSAAGIAVQLWIGAALTLAGYFVPTSVSPVFSAIMAMNILSIALNLLPFAKLDGYWIISDMIGLQDLNKQSFALLGRLISSRADRDILPKLQIITVIANAIGLVVFYGFICIMIFSFILTIVQQFINSGSLLVALMFVAERPIKGLSLFYLATLLARRSGNHIRRRYGR